MDYTQAFADQSQRTRKLLTRLEQRAVAFIVSFALVVQQNSKFVARFASLSLCLLAVGYAGQLTWELRDSELQISRILSRCNLRQYQPTFSALGYRTYLDVAQATDIELQTEVGITSSLHRRQIITAARYLAYKWRNTVLLLAAVIGAGSLAALATAFIVVAACVIHPHLPKKIRSLLAVGAIMAWYQLLLYYREALTRLSEIQKTVADATPAALGFVPDSDSTAVEAGSDGNVQDAAVGTLPIPRAQAHSRHAAASVADGADLQSGKGPPHVTSSAALDTARVDSSRERFTQPPPPRPVTPATTSGADSGDSQAGSQTGIAQRCNDTCVEDVDATWRIEPTGVAGSKGGDSPAQLRSMARAALVRLKQGGSVPKHVLGNVLGGVAGLGRKQVGDAGEQLGLEGTW